MNHSPDGSNVLQHIDCNFCKVQQFNEKSKPKIKKNRFFFISGMKNRKYALY